MEQKSYALPEYSWGDWRACGMAQARLIAQPDRWLLGIRHADWGGTGSEPAQTTHLIALSRDYFDVFSSGDFLFLLRAFNYGVDEVSLLQALPLLKLGEPRAPQHSSEVFLPENRDLWPQMGILDMLEITKRPETEPTTNQQMHATVDRAVKQAEETAKVRMRARAVWLTVCAVAIVYGILYSIFCLR